METIAAITKGEKTLPLMFHVKQMGERERWYAALLVAENPMTFAEAEEIDVGYTGAESDRVIVSAAGCERLVSPVTVTPDNVRKVLEKLGWEWTIVDIGEDPTDEQLRQPFHWATVQAAFALRG